MGRVSSMAQYIIFLLGPYIVHRLQAAASLLIVLAHFTCLGPIFMSHTSNLAAEVLGACPTCIPSGDALIFPSS